MRRFVFIGLAIALAACLANVSCKNSSSKKKKPAANRMTMDGVKVVFANSAHSYDALNDLTIITLNNSTPANYQARICWIGDNTITGGSQGECVLPDIIEIFLTKDNFVNFIVADCFNGGPATLTLSGFAQFSGENTSGTFNGTYENDVTFAQSTVTGANFRAMRP